MSPGKLNERSDEEASLQSETSPNQDYAKLISNTKYLTHRINIENGIDRYLLNSNGGPICNYIEQINKAYKPDEENYLSTADFETGLRDFYPEDDFANLIPEQQMEIRMLYVMHMLGRDNEMLHVQETNADRIEYIKRLFRLELIPEERGRLQDDELESNLERLYPLPSTIPHEITLLQEDQIYTQQERFFVRYIRTIERRIMLGATIEDLEQFDRWVLHNCGYYGIENLKVGEGMNIESFKGSVREFDLKSVPSSFMPTVFDNGERFTGSDNPVINPEITKNVLSNIIDEMDYDAIASILSDGLSNPVRPKNIRSFINTYLNAYASNIRYTNDGQLITSGVDLVISLYEDGATLNGKPFTDVHKHVLQVFGVILDSHKIALERHITEVSRYGNSKEDRDMTSNILNDFLQSISILV